MNLNALFAEQANVVAFPPADLAGATGLATPWISLKTYARATLLLNKAAGNAAEDPTLTLQQATNVGGAGAKALSVIARLHKKESVADLETIGVWSEVVQAAAATYVGDGDVEALYAIDVRAEDLDADNGFDCFRATIADVGTNAQLGALIVILWGARYAPPLTPLTN